MAGSVEGRTITDYVVSALPNTAFYIPNFISCEEEAYLLECIQNRPVRDWTELSKRRLQVWPSRLSNNKLVEKPLPRWLSHPCISRMLSLDRLPDILPRDDDSSTSIPRTGHIFASSPHGAPNHVLINEYCPGQGIMPHEDGAAYFPVVATVSLGASIVLDIYEKDGEKAGSEPKYRILQESRSLLITTDELYTQYLHGIQEIGEDKELGRRTVANWDLLENKDEYASGACERRTRTSLTFRDVLQVVKPTKLFPGMSGR